MQTFIATFFSHFGAIRFNKQLKEAGIQGKLMPVPRRVSSRRRAANSALKVLSIPLVGSSSSRSFGPVSSTLANAPRCCSPPDRS